METLIHNKFLIQL